MAFTFQDLNLTDVKAATGGGLLPVGRHIVTIREAELAPTKSGKGHMVNIRFSGDEGSIRTSYNVQNVNPEAERIGREQFKGLLVNAQHPNPNNPSDIKSIRGLRVGIVVKDFDDNYTRADGTVATSRRDVSGYFMVDGDAKGGQGDDLATGAIPF